MIQGHMHFTKISRAGSSGKGGGCETDHMLTLPFPSELLVIVLTPSLLETSGQLSVHATSWGQGDLCIYSSVWSVLFVSLFWWDPAVPSRSLVFDTINSDPPSRTEKPVADMLSEQPLAKSTLVTDFHTGVKLDFLGATLELQQRNWKWNQASEYPLFPWLRRTELSVWTFECEWS